ncbi:uncharacterized protein LOC142583321 [Dermacentor variabilis]|uniref:uncharacterized protein LOC142583321 n=1 Tax=Dermacentor variabilis TaxID=34621 RepID=UPI003F5C4B20
MTNGVYTAVLVAITFAICPASNGEYFLGCPPVDDVHDTVTILPNPFNCSTFYICAQGTPLLFLCPGILQFNYELQVCDYPEQANCFELQQYPEPVANNLSVFQPAAEHLLPEQAAKSEHEAGPEPTSEEGVLTPELKTEHAQERAQSDPQDMVVPSNSIDEPLQTRSEEQVNKDDLVEPLESIGTPEPQTSQEQAEPQHQQKDNERSDESERELEPVSEPTNGAPGFELQPAGNPTEPGIQDTVITAESIDEPNQEPSQEPTESNHETEPQALKDQAEPELERDINAHSEQEFGRAIERTDSTPEPEPRPTRDPSQPERQDMVLPAESGDATREVHPQQLNETDHTTERALQSVVSAPESEPRPSEEKAVPEREKVVNGEAIQTKNEEAPVAEPNAPTTESERHLTEQPAESEIDTETAVQHVEPAGEQEQASSEKLAAATLQPEPQPTDGQAAAETVRQSDDFQPTSTEFGHEGVPESTEEPAQSQTQQPNEPSEVVHDTAEETAEQTVEPAQELAEAAPEPTAVAPQLEAEAVEEPVGIVRKPSETVQGQQPARGPEQQDQTTEIAQPLHEPLQSAYESTGKTVESDTTKNEAILSPQSEQSVPDPEQIITKQPFEDKAEQSEIKPQLRPTQQPLSVLDEASPNSDASGTDMVQLTQERVESSTELDQSEKQATPKSADAQPQLTEVTQEPQPAPEAELLQPEAADGTVEHSPSANEAPVEARSEEAPAGQSDEIKAIQTVKSIETKHPEVASDTEDDVEPTSRAETEPPVSEKAPEPLEHKGNTTEIGSDTALSHQDDASTSEPNAHNQDAIHQASGGPSGTAQFEPAPTDAAEQGSKVAEPTLEPESSAGKAVAEEQSKADNAYEETEQPAVFDDVDEEGTRSNAIEIDYYT